MESRVNPNQSIILTMTTMHVFVFEQEILRAPIFQLGVPRGGIRSSASNFGIYGKHLGIFVNNVTIKNDSQLNLSLLKVSAI